jgi:hypothetical protein
LLWLNPFVADLDLMCTTAPGGYQDYTCDYVASVTGTPYFSTGNNDCPLGNRCVSDVIEGVKLRAVAEAPLAVGGAIAVAQDANGFVAAPVPADVRAEPAQQQQLPTFGFPRDTFWPRTAASFAVVGVVLTLLSAQLVAPTRRIGIRIRGRFRAPLAARTPAHAASHAGGAGDVVILGTDAPSAPSVEDAPGVPRPNPALLDQGPDTAPTADTAR